MREVIWKDIEGYPFYQVSTLGEIRSFRSRSGKLRDNPKILKKVLTERKYFRVGLYPSIYPEKSKQVLEFVHRLVAIAFIPTETRELHVAHLDGNPSNNTVENLQWCSAKENMSHKVLHGTHLIGVNANTAKLDDEKVLEIRRIRTEENLTWAEIANIFNVSPSVVRMAGLKKSWKHVA